MSVHPKYLVIIAGPTAVGKTSVAIQLAKYFNTEIISADSRQIFKELNIGVARPSEEELKEVKHHLIATKSIHEYFSAGEYEREVLALLDELYKKNDLVILCGGTGFYINAVLSGFDEIPIVDDNIRTSLNQQFQENGILSLQEQLKILDEKTYHSIDLQNTQRVIRALEICIGTGKPFSDFKIQKEVRRNFIPIKIGLNLDKEILQERINVRVDKMMRDGLLEEAQSLHAYQNLNALQTVGYKELFDFINKKISLKEAIELIKIHTRQYAKRQLTFFNKHPDYSWLNPNDWNNSIPFIENIIKKNEEEHSK
ncbi:MAG: tRNA ((37)-N6)-dimethylallyltransferase MiaA [Bacteroidota bacterium]|jgi:tRNA dimethylallyltransferase